MCYSRGSQSVNKQLIYHRPAKVACLRVSGPYCTSVPTAWGAMRSWALDRKLYAKVKRAFGMSLDDPSMTDERDIRYIACLEFYPDAVGCRHSDRARAIFEKTIPGGVYATFAHEGDHVGIGKKFSQIRREWIAKAHLAIDIERPFLEIYNTAGRKTDSANYSATLAVPVMTPDCRPIELNEKQREDVA